MDRKFKDTLVYYIMVAGFVLASFGCTRETHESNSVQVRLPAAHFVPQQSATMSEEEWGLTDPASMSEIGCYAIAVEWAGSANTGICKDAGGNVVLRPGALEGLFAGGSEISLSVPSGAARKISLIGFRAASAESCKNAKGEMPKSELSAPRILASATYDLAPGVKEISFTPSIENSVEFEDCGWPRAAPPPVHPVISAVVVRDQSSAILAPPNEVNVGDSVTLEVEATDPRGLPLEYTYKLFRGCSLAQEIESWSSSSTMGYTFTNDDVTACTMIVVGVRNNDGIDFDSPIFGDGQHSVTFSVSNGTDIPELNSVAITDGFSNPLAPPYNVNVGDTVNLTLDASDPNGLPLEYTVKVYRNCSYAEEVQAWSSNNFVSYTFTADDSTACTMLMVGVRNNDGVDLDSPMLGDLQHSVMFNVSDGTTPASFNNIDVLDEFFSPIVGPTYNVTVGETINLDALGYDANALPLEYTFLLYRNCSYHSELQAFSMLNTATYTFTPDDITACTMIVVGVRNNDGNDFDSSMLGDAQQSLTFNVSAP